MEFSKEMGPLKGYIDASYAGDLDTRRSTTGFMSSAYMVDKFLSDQLFNLLLLYLLQKQST